MAVQAPQAIRSARVRAIEKRFGEPLEKVLRRLYYEEDLTQTEVAKRLRVQRGTLAGWMIRLGINQRALAGQAAQAAKELAS
jgi:predicted DNA-binding protein (UPF0251 family)